MADKEVDWHWPEDGSEIDLVNEVNGISSPYEDECPMCYPGTKLNTDIAAAASLLISKQINSIGNHSHAVRQEADGTWVYREGEGGFDQVQKIERQALWMVASVLGISDPSKVEGYFCGGGTEANIEGIWIGREFLRHCPDPYEKDIAVLTSPLRHYSIDKAVRLTGIGEAQKFPCQYCGRNHIFVPDPGGKGLNLVGMDYDEIKKQSNGEMSITELKKIFRRKYDEGFRRFLIVPTVGTCLTGSIDPIKAIGEFIREASRETGAFFYLHVDASFAGFTVPFVAPDLEIAFSVPEVMSITLDADKMGNMPYPAGVFLCRKGLMSHVGQKVNYVRGNEDDTLSGSRSCLAPVLIHNEMKRLGRSGQREFVRKCLNARNVFVNLARKKLPWVNILTNSPYVNFAPMEINIHEGKVPDFFLEKTIGEKEWPSETTNWLTESLTKKIPRELQHITLLAEIKSLNGVLERYHLRPDCFPGKPTDPQSCPIMVYKICIMPHNSDPAKQERFIADLATVKNSWKVIDS